MSISPDELAAMSASETTSSIRPRPRVLLVLRPPERRGICSPSVEASARRVCTRRREVASTAMTCAIRRSSIGPFAHRLAKRMGSLSMAGCGRTSAGRCRTRSERNATEWATHLEVDREALRRWLAGTHYRTVLPGTADRVLRNVMGTTTLAEVIRSFTGSSTTTMRRWRRDDPRPGDADAEIHSISIAPDTASQGAVESDPGSRGGRAGVHERVPRRAAADL